VKKIISEEKKSWEKDQEKGDKRKNKEVNAVEEEHPSSIGSVDTKDLGHEMAEVDALLASMMEMAEIDT
jgi:hypothetical protein